MKQFKLDCYEISKNQKEEIQDSMCELILEALDDYKLSKKGGSKCQHMINPDTIG